MPLGKSLTIKLTSDRTTAGCSTRNKAYLENQENYIRLHHITKRDGIREDVVMILKYSLQIKMAGLPSQKLINLLFHSLHVSAKINHHQVICEKYVNDNGII